MELKIELKDEVVQDAAENIAKHLNNCTRELRRLYLVEDYVDSLKVCFSYIQGSHKLWKSWKTWKITKINSMLGKIMEF